MDIKRDAEILKMYPEVPGESEQDVHRLPAPALSLGGPGVGGVPVVCLWGFQEAWTALPPRPWVRRAFSEEPSCEWAPCQALSLPAVIGLAFLSLGLGPICSSPTMHHIYHLMLAVLIMCQALF